MLLALLLNPILVLIAVGVGAALCRLNGLPVHGREMLAAAAVGIFAAESAVVLAVTQRHASSAEAAPAALLAMGLHMLLSLMLTIVVIFSHQVGGAFTWWMLAMFWTTLFGVSVVLARLLRRQAQPKVI